MITFDDVKQLMEQTGDTILSLYLQVDPSLLENQAETPAWRIYAKNALKDVEASIDPTDKQAVATWQDIRGRAETLLDRYSPEGKGLALFVGPGIEESYSLPVPPLHNDHHLGTIYISPLLWLMDEYEQYLIVLVDKDEAHFLSMYLGDIDREEAMASERFTFDYREKTLMPRPSGTQHDSGNHPTVGSNRDAFEDRMEDMIAKFHRQVAQHAEEMLKNSGAKRIILGGSERAAHAVEDFLHEKAQKAVVGVLPVPLQESDRRVMARILPTALNYERDDEMRLVKEVIDAAKSGGRGAVGLEEVEKALEMYKVALLISPWPVDDEKRFHKMTVRTVESGGNVELVHGEAAEKLKEHGGIAARLHFVVQEQ